MQSGYFSAAWGIDGDAHAGHRHRQVSLLSADKIAAFNEKGAGVVPGAFGENLVVEGFDFRALPVGTLLRCGDVLLEMTQIGKECHSHCEIFKKMGDCIMPREGVFARVLEPGEIHVGDEMAIEPRRGVRPWQAAVFTLSAKGARGGGTGLSPRDVTPEATLAVATRLAPGIAEAIRAESLKITKHAMLSRAQSVIRGKTLIINLPGSPKACMESMDVFMDTIPHAMGLLRNEVQDCART